eukprot:jgi/Psemu1/36216/gm1.36216_g
MAKHKLPLNTFKSIFQWAKKTICDNLQSNLGISDMKFHPHILNWLPDNKPTQVYVRSFKDAIYSLLSDQQLLMREENLSFQNYTNPLSPDNNPELNSHPAISELHHDSWWKASWKLICNPNSQKIHVPILYYMDGISLDAHRKLALMPLNMTLGIFNSTRHSCPASLKGKIQNLHNGLKVALHSCKDACNENGEWKVKMKFVIAYVIGNTKLHDKLCGKYSSFNKALTKKMGIRRYRLSISNVNDDKKDEDKDKDENDKGVGGEMVGDKTGDENNPVSSSASSSRNKSGDDDRRHEDKDKNNNDKMHINQKIMPTRLLGIEMGDEDGDENNPVFNANGDDSYDDNNDKDNDKDNIGMGKAPHGWNKACERCANKKSKKKCEQCQETCQWYSTKPEKMDARLYSNSKQALMILVEKKGKEELIKKGIKLDGQTPDGTLQEIAAIDNMTEVTDKKEEEEEKNEVDEEGVAMVAALQEEVTDKNKEEKEKNKAIEEKETEQNKTTWKGYLPSLSSW